MPFGWLYGSRVAKRRVQRVSDVITVQGSFLPYGATGIFFVWGLALDGRGRYRPTDVEALYPLLAGLLHAHTLTCTLRVPEGKRMVSVKVPGVAISVGNAAQWLMQLPVADGGGPLHLGRSLQVFRTAAQFVLELLGRGRVVPALRAEAGALSAGWQLCASEPIDAERMARLEAAMPEVCRAVIPPDRNPKKYHAPSHHELLTGFMEAATTALATQAIAEQALSLGEGGGERSTLAHWLRALSGQEKADLPPGLPDAYRLYKAVDSWTAPVTGVRGHSTLRTGIRLNLPGDDQESNFEVELILQTATVPPVTIPAQAAWEALGGELVIGDDRYAHAEKRLLADLPAMAGLYPPLEPLCSAAAPGRVRVGLAEVVALLTEGAELLQEAGFPVLLPAALVRAGSLRAKLNIKPAGSAEPKIGLSQLVDVDWELALGGLPISHGELQRLAELRRPLVAHDGRWVQVDEKALETALKHVETHSKRMELGTALRLGAATRDRAAADRSAAEEGTARAAAKTDPIIMEATTGIGWVADLLTRLRAPGRMEEVPVPAGFQGSLRPYQQRGLNWLAFLRRYGLGACLADDMGLGKTVQVTALLLHEREQKWTSRPTLLVCPVSLVGNWRRELARFAPGLKVLVHHGSGRTTHEAFAASAYLHDVVITTYAVAAQEAKGLRAVAWAGIIADEAQNLKNPATRHAQSLRQLPADYRIALTGTPVENHLGDLWALFSFLNPGLLGGAEPFRREFAIPIERLGDAEAAERLGHLVQPFLLRRVKSDPAIIQDLPEKLEAAVYVNLTLEQAALYEAVVQQTLDRVNDAVGIQRHGAVLAGLTRLKQICNHPVMLHPDGGVLEGRSGKLDRLTEMLEEVLAEGERALIFTQFSAFGARLQAYLERRFGCPVLFLDGSTPRPQRERLVARFQAGEAPLFVLSLKAGGVGLNLTAANHVFHFDRWWNPAIEDQATDRAYRIGQTRTVLVHKLVTAGTLEERIDQILQEKRQIAGQVIGSGESWLGSLTSDELRRLITLQGE